jgi:hypothetical protein
VAIRYIDFNRLDVYEAGAVLLTLLAYPRENKQEDEQRGRLHESLCACALRARYETDPDWATSPQLVKPIYAFQSKTACNRGLKQFKRRLRDRMIAARMAYPFLKEAETGRATRAPHQYKTALDQCHIRTCPR